MAENVKLEVERNYTRNVALWTIDIAFVCKLVGAVLHCVLLHVARCLLALTDSRCGRAEAPNVHNHIGRNSCL